MKGTTIFTILMFSGLFLMAFGVNYMPTAHDAIHNFSWYDAVAIVGLFVEIIAFGYLNKLTQSPY